MGLRSPNGKWRWRSEQSFAKYVAHELRTVASAKTEPPRLRDFCEADARTRTADPFITSEVLYQLSYVGEAC